MTLRDSLARRLSAVLIGALALTASAALALASERNALWHVVRACAADARLTSLPFPCLAVDLTGGVERGHILLRPPWANDLILSPTRRSIGVEDPFLQSPEAPNYFAEAWQARSMIKTVNGQPPARDQVALIVNAGNVRAQDQLHIHIGCLDEKFRRSLAAVAPSVPRDRWTQIGFIKRYEALWALRVKSEALKGVNPFRLVHRGFDGAVRNPADEMIMVAGARVDDADEFLIVVVYGRAPRPWLKIGSEDFIDRKCVGDGAVEALR